jgi:hypothetical protein
MRYNNKMVKYLMLLLILQSCFKQDKTTLDCEDLAMKFYRGLPKPSALYVKYCKEDEAKLKYAPANCQKALGILMLTGSSKKVKEGFGELAMGCFNQGDLDRFLKDQP